MKDSISLTYPTRSGTITGLLFAAVTLGMLAWMAVESLRGRMQITMLPGESVFSLVGKELLGFGIMVTVLVASLLFSLVHWDYVFDRGGVTITRRWPSRKPAVQTVPWDGVEKVEARQKGGFAGGSYILSLKLKSGRDRHMALVQSKEEVLALRDEIMALRGGNGGA